MIITQDENFAEYFTLAQEEALTPRQNRIVGLRYGFASGEHYTLEQIGQEFGISRERIRQILQQSLRKIRSKGRRQITKGQTDSACAKLFKNKPSLSLINLKEKLVSIIQMCLK